MSKTNLMNGKIIDVYAVDHVDLVIVIPDKMMFILSGKEKVVFIRIDELEQKTVAIMAESLAESSSS